MIAKVSHCMFTTNMQQSNTFSDIKILPSHHPLTVKEIFWDNDNWKRYAFNHKNELREVEVQEVEKMLLCKDALNGYYTCYCPNCDELHAIFLGCNSRLCSHCGKRYTDQWAKGLHGRLFPVPHRHFVLSVASQLRPVLLSDRSLWKVLMNAAIRAINNVLSYCTRQNIRAGAIVVLHPFGKNLQFNPHLHVLVTEGGFRENGKFVHKFYFPAKAMRKVWQYEVLTSLKSALPDTPSNCSLIDSLFKRYSEGFYVWLPKDSRIDSTRIISKYVGRYVRHPAIADYRLCCYDGSNVTFWYDDRDGEQKLVTLSVDAFIRSVIQHIPEKHFKMIRYYGVYCRKWIGRYRRLLGPSSITQTNLTDFCQKPRLRCPKCGGPVEVLFYHAKGPPDIVRFGGSLDDWAVVMGSCSSQISLTK